MKLPAIRRVVGLIVLLALLAGCSATPGGATVGGVTGGSAITIENAYARPSPSEGGNGAAFMTIASSGGATYGGVADRLVAAQSAAAQTVELHETTQVDGVMKMRPVPDGFEVPANGRVELKPGGKHIMLIGLTAPLVAGQEIELTLTFDKAPSQTITLPVRE